MAILTKLTFPFDYYAIYTYEGTNSTELKCEHVVWLTEVVSKQPSDTAGMIICDWLCRTPTYTHPIFTL